MSAVDAAFRRLEHGLAAVMAIYKGSDGEATRRLYAELETRGPRGVIAVNVLRAVKCSERAKLYRGRGYKGSAYDRKHWSMGNLCRVLAEHGAALGIAWGWREDPRTEGFPWVLYVQLPEVGQVSFHDSTRGSGPDFALDWDGVRGAAPTRACSFAVRVLELPPPSAAVGPDEDGHCRRCGLEFEDPRELTHECPPGFTAT